MNLDVWSGGWKEEEGDNEYYDVEVEEFLFGCLFLSLSLLVFGA